MATIGERLKAERNKRGLTLKRVQELTGINLKTLGGYENNHSEPDVKTMSILASFYNVSAHYLVTGEDDNFKPSPKDKRDLKRILEQNEEELMFDGMPLDEDDRKRIDQILETLFWEAKKMNKRKK